MDEEDDKLFYAIDLEDSFAYPNVYPDDCESSEIWYYAKGSLADDAFICKLDKLHNLERCTLHEEDTKSNKRKTSVSATFDNFKKSASKRLTWPRSKISTTKTNDMTPTLRHNVTKRIIPSPIPTRNTTTRALSAGMIRRDKIPPTCISKYRLSDVQENEIIEVQKKLHPVEYKENSASFKKFADTYIKNTFKTARPPPIPKPPTVYNRVNNRVNNRVIQTPSKAKRNLIRSNSVTPQPRSFTNCVGKPPLIKPPKYRQKCLEKNDIIDKVCEQVKNEKLGIDKRLKDEGMEKLGIDRRSKDEGMEHSDQQSKLEEEEYGENEEERALFAVALPDVLKHYSKHTRVARSHLKTQSAAA